MAWTHTERHESGNGELSRNSSDELNYTVEGNPDPAGDDADNPLKLIAYAVSFALATYNGNPFDTMKYDRAGYPGGWFVSFRYRSDMTPTGDSTFTFNTAGGTQHIVVPRSHVKTYRGPAVTGGGTTQAAGPYDGLLNVDKDGEAQGLDLPTAAFAFQVTLYAHPSVVTQAYVALLYNLTDTVAANVFTIAVDGVSLTFQPGECRFDGATGAKRGYGDWELTLNFSASPNKTGLTVGSGANAVTGVDKDGWDYLWPSTRFDVVTTGAKPKMVPVLEYVMIDRVYLRQNWAGLIPNLPSSPFGGGGALPTGG